MNRQQANRRVAEILGWTEVTQRSNDSQPFGKGPKGWDVLPDFCSDLNACHEMERDLSEDETTDFVHALEHITNSQFGFFNEVHATALQRTEAFLRVKDPGFFK